MMNNMGFKLGGAFVLSALLMVGCGGGGPTSYQNVNDTTKNTTIGINSTDLVETAKVMIDKMLNSKKLMGLKGKHVIEISNIINDTTQPNLDMNFLTDRIVEVLEEKLGDKFEVTRASGGSGTVADERMVE